MANDAMREGWTAGGVGWVEHEAVFDAVFAPVTEAILAAAGVEAGQRVLDVGCGSGTLLAAVAEAGATPVGVDISTTMAKAAQQRVPAATVLVADAQTDALPGPFDRVLSRFGVMFFDDPVAAFANVHAASAPGAGLTFACWRTQEENPMMTLGQTFLLERMGEEPQPEEPFAPGPNAFADPGHTRTVLEEAGWSDVTLAPLDFTVDYAYDGSDGVEHRMATLFAATTGRRARATLEPRLGQAGWAALVDDLRTHLRDRLVDGALRVPGSCWLVTASA
jgi:SAM-dependent methyltransferase